MQALRYSLRTVSAVVSILLILWWAENAVPMGAVLVFLLLTSIIITWCIISLMNDDTFISNLFDD
ncbi:MAG TPA: hypothetical protein VD884_12590 [Ohtaekwangia sp.]|nr:hypothetical protein [Ohtaekwangia sp.]